MRKRLLALALSFLMVLCAFPLSVLPTAAAGSAGEEKEAVLSKTVFSPSHADTWAVFDAYNPTLMALGDYVGVTYPDAWQIGYKTVSGEADNFAPYTRLYKASNSGQMILSANGGYWTQVGGMYITGEPNLMFSAMSYSSDYTSVSSHVADPTIRYTAEYTGTALISLNELSFYANNGATLKILHNGKPLATYEASGAMYRVQDGAFVKGAAANVGADLGVLTVELVKGDSLDFVSCASDDFCGANKADFGLTAFGSNEYGFCAKRGVYDFEIAVTYRTQKDGTVTGAASTQVSVNGATPLPLFVWYDAQGNLLADGATRPSATPPTPSATDKLFSSLIGLIDWFGIAGGYARVNPDLIGDVIPAGATYPEVLEAYKSYVKGFVSASYTGSFLPSLASGEAFDRFCFPFGRNLFSVKQNGSALAGTVDYSLATDTLITATFLDAAIERWFENAATVQPSGSTAAELRVTTEQLAAGMAFSTDGTSPSKEGAATYQNNTLYLTPYGGVSALTYTVPSGLDLPLISLAASAVGFDGTASAFRYAIAVNGKVVWPAGADLTSFTASSESDGGWAVYTSLAELQSTLASLSFEVKSGDKVSFCVAGEEVKVSLSLSAKVDNYHDVRALEIVSGNELLHSGLYTLGSTVTLSELGLPSSFGKNGVFLNHASTTVSLPKTVTMNGDVHIADFTLTTSASISITSAFALNLYVKAEKGADGAGVVIGGVKHAGSSQGNGVFRLSIPVTPKEMPDKAITYRAYQTKNGVDVMNTETVELRVFDLLSAYEASEDRDLALLASTVRYYSLAARDYFVNDRVTLSDAEKSALREYDGELLSMTAAYRAGTAYQPYPAGVNVDSFPFRIKGASLKLDDRLAFAFRTDRTNGALFGEAGLSLRVTDEEGTLRYTADVGAPFDAAGLEMLYFVKNLPATEYGTDFSFTLVDGDGAAKSATLSYSVHAYIARTFDTASGDDTTFHYLLRGIYALGEASAAYAATNTDFDKDFSSPVGDGGDAIASDSPVLSDTVYDPASATVLAAASLPTASLTRGKVYRVEGTATLSSSFNGNGAILIAPNGIVIDGAANATVSGVTVVGPLTVRNSKNVLLEGCQILNAGSYAFTAEKSASGILLNACRLVGHDAVTNAASDLAIVTSYLGFTRYGVHDTASEGTVIENCRLAGTGVGTAIYSTASESSFRFNTVKLSKNTAIGILLEGNGKTRNVLVAQNVITGTYRSISASGLLNASFVLNSAVIVEASGNKNLYICDNAIGGRLILANNNYLLANGNIYPTDKIDHTASATGNANVNGTDLTDVNARLAAGADEDLLPHLDKDLFLDMTRKTAVKDVRGGTSLSLYSYILQSARTSAYVVVAPGAYAVEETAAFTAAHNGTTVYAYGVLAEGVRYANANYTKAHVTATDVSNLAIKGLSIGYAQPTGGQVYVLNKLGSNQILVATAAGFFNDFSVSNPSILRNATDFALYRAGADYPIGEAHLTSVEKNSDGTMTITLPSADYEIIKKGDVMTCRLANYVHVVHTKRCTNILLEDFTQYGYAGGYAFYEEYNETGVVYHRVADTNKAGMVIDKATYDQYAAWESTYGVDLEISTDAQGRYRGPDAKVSSLDGVHTSFGGNGPQIISSIIEKMTDDGSNINAYHSRLGGVVDNGDGTLTLIYKGNLTGRIYGLGSTSGAYDNRNCAPFRVGDRILIYTAAGQLVCDTLVLSTVCGAGLSYYDKITSTYTSSVFGGLPITRYAVKVAKSAVNTAALSGYDLTDDSEDDTKKVLVENVSRSSAGALYDNSVFRCGLGSAMRLKASGSVIQNCTVDKIAKPGICMTMDVWWGESGVASDILIKNNVIGRTGYSIYGIRPIEATDTNYKSVPITIMGLGGSSMDEDYLIFRDIVIEGNKFTDRCLDNYNAAIYARAVKNLTVRNNDFGSVSGENASKYCGVLYLNGVANAELSGNTYSPYVSGNYSLYVQGRPYKNIYGTDVVIGGVSKIPNKS